MSDIKTGFFTTEDQAHLFYTVEGSGPPMVLLHGWPLSSEIWVRNRKELSKHFRLITYDFRGHGRSSKVLGGHTALGYAEDLNALLDFLEISKCILVAWSMGACIALKYIEHFGQSRLCGLALIDGHPATMCAADWNTHILKGYNMPQLTVLMQEAIADYPLFCRNQAANNFKGGPTVQQSDLDFLAGEIAKTPPWIAFAIYNDRVMQDMRNILPQIMIPTIVAEPDTPPKTAMGGYMAAEIPSAKLYLFSEASHVLFYDYPEKFNNMLIKEFG